MGCAQEDTEEDDDDVWLGQREHVGLSGTIVPQRQMGEVKAIQTVEDGNKIILYEGALKMLINK